MNPEELSEAEKWDNYNAAMAKEREYIALWEGRRRQREKTWKLIRWAIVFWLGFVVWLLMADTPFFRDLERLTIP